MRLDHLLSKEEKVESFYCCLLLGYQVTKAFGGDALRGNTRSHPEHDGKDLSGRWYCTGDGVGEQVAASSLIKRQGKMSMK